MTVNGTGQVTLPGAPRDGSPDRNGPGRSRGAATTPEGTRVTVQPAPSREAAAAPAARPSQ